VVAERRCDKEGGCGQPRDCSRQTSYGRTSEQLFTGDDIAEGRDPGECHAHPFPERLAGLWRDVVEENPFVEELVE